MEAIGKNVVLDMIQEEEMKGGFYVTNNSKPKPQKGKIISVGRDVENGSYLEGKTAVTRPDAGIEISLPGVLGEGKFKVVDIKDILIVY